MSAGHVTPEIRKFLRAQQRKIKRKKIWWEELRVRKLG